MLQERQLGRRRAAGAHMQSRRLTETPRIGLSGRGGPAGCLRPFGAAQSAAYSWHGTRKHDCVWQTAREACGPSVSASEGGRRLCLPSASSGLDPTACGLRPTCLATASRSHGLWATVHLLCCCGLRALIRSRPTLAVEPLSEAEPISERHDGHATPRVVYKPSVVRICGDVQAHAACTMRT